MLALAPASPAQEPAAVVVAATNVPLVAAGDGGWTAPVTLTNVTLEPLNINSQPGDLGDRDCKPKVPPTLAPAQTTSFAVRVPTTCASTAGGAFEFEIDVEMPNGDTLASVLFTARPTPGVSEPSTGAATAIAILLGAAAVAAGLLLLLRRGGPAP